MPVDYEAPELPPSTETVTSSRYIGGIPGDTRIPGPNEWGTPNTRPGGFERDGWWFRPRRSESLTLDELRAGVGDNELPGSRGGYMDGDEWMPVNESTTVIEDLQRRLYQAGLLDGDDDIQPGYFDDATRKAFKLLLERANGRRTDWQSTLEDLQTNPMPADQEAAPPPFVAQTSNPEDIKMNLQDHFRAAIGSGAIKPEDLQAMIAEFQGTQVASQRGQYDAYQGSGGTVEAAPSIEAFADQKAQELDPTAYSAHKYLDKFSAIENMLAGGTASTGQAA